MKKSTMVELVAELKEIRSKETNKNKIIYLNHMIRDAESGEYHDYKNNKYVCGKVALVAHLHTLELMTLANAVKNGEYDEPADESDKETLREHAIEFGLTEHFIKNKLGL